MTSDLPTCAELPLLRNLIFSGRETDTPEVQIEQLWVRMIILQLRLTQVAKLHWKTKRRHARELLQQRKPRGFDQFGYYQEKLLRAFLQDLLQYLVDDRGRWEGIQGALIVIACASGHGER